MNKLVITQGQKEGLHEFLNDNTDVGHLPLSDELLDVLLLIEVIGVAREGKAFLTSPQNNSLYSYVGGMK